MWTGAATLPSGRVVVKAEKIVISHSMNSTSPKRGPGRSAVGPLRHDECRGRARVSAGRAVPTPLRLNGARHADGTVRAGGAGTGRKHAADERRGGEGGARAVAGPSAGRAETIAAPEARRRRYRSWGEGSRPKRAAEAQRAGRALDNRRRSALGARRSALGARRSALGARRSALICARVDTPVIVDTTAPDVRRRRTINAACMASQWLVSGPCRHLFPPMSERPASARDNHVSNMSFWISDMLETSHSRSGPPATGGAGEERDHALANARAHREEQSARADLGALVETCPVGVRVLDAATGAPLSLNRGARRPAHRARASGALPGMGARVGGVPARRRARGPARRTLTRRRATARRSWSR